MPLMLRYVARSDVGLVREGNEDSGYAGPRLLAVADGMGGHAAGEVASSATIEELVHIENAGSDGDPLEALRAAVKAANDRIKAIVRDDPARHGMGTTLTALLWTGDAVAVAHIGDSRAYLLRDGELRQVTHDHTFVQQLVDEGRITPDEATIHPARSMILRALQGDSDPEPDLDRIEVRPGDRFLICSDGLSGVVRDETMRDALVRHTGLREAAEALVQLAMRGGAPDNVTCVVADVIETESMPAADDTAEAFLVGAASAEQGPRSEPHGRRGPGAAMRSLLGSSERSGHVDDADASEQLRYAPRPPRRFRWLRRLAIIAVIAALAWGGLVLADNYVRGQYYVGDQAGEVAIFRGVSQDIGPVRLYNVHEIAPGLPVGALPELFRDQVTDTIPASDLPKAEEIVERLRGEACAVHEPTARPSPSPVTTTPPVTPPAAAAPPAATTPSPLPTAPPGYPGLDCAELR